jgi:small neutral amino acid transporter SnatA (MarC family)
VLFVSSAPQRWPEWVVAVAIAVAASFLVLAFAERITRTLGERTLAALERLMGLILTAIAVEMLLRGIEAFVRQLATAS